MKVWSILPRQDLLLIDLIYIDSKYRSINFIIESVIVKPHTSQKVNFTGGTNLGPAWFLRKTKVLGIV